MKCPQADQADGLGRDEGEHSGATVTMPRLWSLSREKGYITASDFVKDRFGSLALAVMIAITGIVAELPYIALQIVGMQSVLTVMLAGSSNAQTVGEISLLISFIITSASLTQ